MPNIGPQPGSPEANAALKSAARINAMGMLANLGPQAQNLIAHMRNAQHIDRETPLTDTQLAEAAHQFTQAVWWRQALDRTRTQNNQSPLDYPPHPLLDALGQIRSLNVLPDEGFADLAQSAGEQALQHSGSPHTQEEARLIAKVINQALNITEQNAIDTTAQKLLESISPPVAVDADATSTAAADPDAGTAGGDEDDNEFADPQSTETIKSIRITENTKTYLGDIIKNIANENEQIFKFESDGVEETIRIRADTQRSIYTIFYSQSNHPGPNPNTEYQIRTSKNIFNLISGPQEFPTTINGEYLPGLKLVRDAIIDPDKCPIELDPIPDDMREYFIFNRLNELRHNGVRTFELKQGDHLDKLTVTLANNQQPHISYFQDNKLLANYIFDHDTKYQDISEDQGYFVPKGGNILSRVFHAAILERNKSTNLFSNLRDALRELYPPSPTIIQTQDRRVIIDKYAPPNNITGTAIEQYSAFDPNLDIVDNNAYTQDHSTTVKQTWINNILNNLQSFRSLTQGMDNEDIDYYTNIFMKLRDAVAKDFRENNTNNPSDYSNLIYYFRIQFGDRFTTNKLNIFLADISTEMHSFVEGENSTPKGLTEFRLTSSLLELYLELENKAEFEVAANLLNSIIENEDADTKIKVMQSLLGEEFHSYDLSKIIDKDKLIQDSRGINLSEIMADYAVQNSDSASLVPRLTAYGLLADLIADADAAKTSPENRQALCDSLRYTTIPDKISINTILTNMDYTINADDYTNLITALKALQTNDHITMDSIAKAIKDCRPYLLGKSNIFYFYDLSPSQIKRLTSYLVEDTKTGGFGIPNNDRTLKIISLRTAAIKDYRKRKLGDQQEFLFKAELRDLSITDEKITLAENEIKDILGPHSTEKALLTKIIEILDRLSPSLPPNAGNDVS